MLMLQVCFFFATELTLKDRYTSSPCSAPNARAYRRGYPKEARTRTGFHGDEYELVFVDEFEVNGRTVSIFLMISLSFQFFFSLFRFRTISMLWPSTRPLLAL